MTTQFACVGTEFYFVVLAVTQQSVGIW